MLTPKMNWVALEQKGFFEPLRKNEEDSFKLGKKKEKKKK